MNNKNFKYKLNNSIITNNTFTKALKEATASTISNTAVESTLNKRSFGETLRDQVKTSFVMAGANLAAKEIGKAAHGSLDIDKNGNLIYNEPTIGKTKQLLLHGVVGATSSKLLGNDALSGAVSGITGEITSDLIFNNLNEKYSNKDGIILKERFELNKEVAAQISGLTGGLSSLITGISSGLSEKEISNNVFNGQRLAENASRNNSTNVKPKTDKDGNIILNKYLVTDAKKDGDTNIYDQNGNKIGETLLDDDYLNRNGDEIDFDTKIGKVLGKDGLYGDNAEELINALIDFEIGSLKNGEENYPYVDYLGIMTTGIGININTNNQIKQLEFVDGSGKLVGDNVILFKELTNIKNKYTSNENNYELKNGIKQLKSDIIKQINNELHDLNYKITEKSKYEVFIKHIKESRNSLSKQFSNYNNIPTSSRMGLIDMIYNLGQNTFRTEYKKLSNAVNNEDWIKAGNESKIYNIQNSRNKWNKEMLQQGDINKTNILNNYNYGKKSHAK